MQFYYRIIFRLVLLISFVPGVKAQYVDLDILKSINPQHPSSQYWKATSSSVFYISAGASFGVLATGFITKNKTMQRNSYETLISIGISTIVSETLKNSINRTRPADRYPNEVFVNSPSHGKSFPSGHTTLAFATATSIAFEYRKWYFVLPAYCWAASVGYSRMYLGRHYPTDALAGAVLGTGSGILSHWIIGKYFKHEKKQSH